MSNILTCKDLSLSYGKKNIIHNLTLNFDNKGLYVLLGANGAGKSTFLKALIQDPSISISGDIIIKEKKYLTLFFLNILLLCHSHYKFLFLIQR